LKSSNKQEFPVLVIEDGAQFTVELSSKEAHLMAASFAHYLLKNIGIIVHFSLLDITRFLLIFTIYIDFSLFRWLGNFYRQARFFLSRNPKISPEKTAREIVASC
jgi:hypothetical protein